MRFLFALQILFGLLMMLQGAIVAVRPHALLDQVLTEAKMQDDQRRDATLAILKKAVGSDPVVWLGGGTAVSIMGVIGLASKPKPPA
jgi:hypothetical protein